MPNATQGTPRRLSRMRRLAFAGAACAGALVLSLGVLLIADLRVHHKFDAIAGLNVWGYRGPTVGRKTREEYRVVVLGGSTVFGYGVPWADAMPAQLQRKLQATRSRFSVVNLGYNNDGAYSMSFTIRDFAFLKPDLVILYEGYNDIAFNTRVFRHDSAVFRLTGYFPMLPIVAREKVMALQYGGDLEAAYRALNKQSNTGDRGPIVFRPKASAPEAVSSAREAIGRQLGRFEPDPVRPAATSNQGRDLLRAAAFYCESMVKVVDVALGQGSAVIVVGQPYYGEAHARQQQILQDTLRDRYGSNPAVRYLDLSREVDLGDRSLTFDGIHLTAAGNARIADGLIKPVMAITARQASSAAGTR